MSDTPAPSADAPVRRIPVIVFERPPVSWPRLFLGLVLGVVLGAVLGAGAWWLATWGSEDVGAEWLLAPPMRYTWPLAFCGLLGGLALGLAYGREQLARIELVEIAPTARAAWRRRRSRSTEVAPPRWS
jgi:hypothetical protein